MDKFLNKYIIISISLLSFVPKAITFHVKFDSSTVWNKPVYSTLVE